jgi:hydroxymethylpyrimidine kinase/phosphomethylpyrimidine kinase
MKVAMTIAGSDSGGGAGIQADLKTFASVGVHGTSALTAITAQNTLGVQGIFALPAEVVGKQINSILTDMKVEGIKTGMLADREIIETVADSIEGLDNIVIDPVMVSATGHMLLDFGAEKALIKRLMPIATLITPNAAEAEVLSGLKIESDKDAIKAARRIGKKTRAVIVKGGHLESKTDFLYVEKELFELPPERKFDLGGRNLHGSGCSFAAAIVAELAKSSDLPDAVRNAKKFMNRAIASRITDVGTGNVDIINQFASRKPVSDETLRKVERAAEKLCSEKGFGDLLPEVGTNIAVLRPDATSYMDVAGVDGRIRRSLHGPAYLGVDYGTSTHVSSVLLNMMEYDPEVGSVINIRYGEDVVAAGSKAGFDMVRIDRMKEPPKIQKREGASLPWVIKTIMDSRKRAPDMIYHSGAVGKEAMSFIFGKDANDIVQKVSKILENLP